MGHRNSHKHINFLKLIKRALTRFYSINQHKLVYIDKMELDLTEIN